MFFDFEQAKLYLAEILDLVLPAILETLYMVFFSTLFSVILGFALGVILVITDKGHIWEKPRLNN